VWVEGGDIHDELLDQLGGVLAPPEDLALTPSAAELEALAVAVAARWPDGAAAPAAAEAEDSPGGTPASPGSPVRSIRSGGRRSLRRLGSGAWRAGSVAAGLVLVSGSAAAAANGGVPLPDPVRVVAYTVGLPVDSPALHETHEDIKELKEAVKANDKPKAEAKARELVHKDLPKVPAAEKKEAQTKVDAAIAVAAEKGLVPPPAPTTTTTMPPATTTTEPAPAPSTTATTAEETPKEKEREKPSGTTKTTETTATTEPEPTTTTTVPASDENPSGDPGAGTGDGGSIGTDPGPTTSTTVPEPTTTTTTGPPPEETTTTTTTAPPTTTTTTTTEPTTQPAGVDGDSQQGQATAASRQRRP
jgi:hypothetical protein